MEFAELSDGFVVVRNDGWQSEQELPRGGGAPRSVDPEETESLWSGFVAGRWALVRYVDQDGKRLVVVRSNENRADASAPLARGERRVIASAMRGRSNKFIAHELGVSPSTVASHLRRALRKLRLGSRRELVQLLGSVAEGSSTLDLAPPRDMRASRFEVAGESFAVFEMDLTGGETELTRALSDAERDVARLALGGKSNPEIAQDRGTSVRTVANQMASIFSKLGVGSRAELYAFDRGRFVPSHERKTRSGLDAP